MSISELSWDFEVDSDVASRVCHNNVKIGKDETAMIFNDLDGSLTGKAGATLVSTDSYLLNGLNCNFKGNWNMTVCEETKHFARVHPCLPSLLPNHATKVNILHSSFTCTLNLKMRRPLS